MKVLLDTNVVLDYLGANQGFAGDAEKVFELAAQRNDIKLVSSSAIYVLKRAVKDRRPFVVSTRASGRRLLFCLLLNMILIRRSHVTVKILRTQFNIR